MPERFALPPVITASSWANAVSSLLSQQRSSRGTEVDDEGKAAPVMTNREALAIVEAMRRPAQRVLTGWPMWYQFAAIAYNWEANPGAPMLDASDERADADFPAYAAVMLGEELVRLAQGLDAVRYPDVRLDLTDVWAQPAVMAEIGAALQDDGAQVSFKIPIPACKDPVTGKPARPVRDPSTGRWTCPGGVVQIDDPITAILKSLSKVAVPVGVILIAYYAFENKRARRRKG